MSNISFEEGEYPFVAKLKRAAILFIQLAFGLLAVIILVRLIELSYGYFVFKIKVNFVVFFIEAFIFTLIYFLKSLPVLFIFFLLLYFSVCKKSILQILTYILFSIYLLVEIFLVKYYFLKNEPLGAELFSKNTVQFEYLFAFNIVWIVFAVIAFTLLWFVFKNVEYITFVDKRYAYCILGLACLLLFLGVSSLPDNYDKKSYNLMVSKQAHFIENSYVYFFGEEPQVDIYDSNYFN